MARDAERRSPQDPAARGFDGRTLSPADSLAPSEPPSPAWLAQLGRAPIGDDAGGRGVVKRLTEGATAVPGDDPLYQYLGAQRMFAQVLQTQHDDQMSRMRAMLDEARQGMAHLLSEAGAAGAAAVAARRGEDEAALKRFSADLEVQASDVTRKLREAIAEERDAMTAAVAVTVAQALVRIEGQKFARADRGRPWWPLGALEGRAVAAWAALLALSVIAGLALLWAVGHLGPGHEGRLGLRFHLKESALVAL
jgi:hypothetical protein